MPKLILCRGIPGCGKSTYTRQMTAQANGQLVRICKDELRLMMHQTHRFGLDKMAFYNDIITGMWVESIKAGYDTVLDETFIRYSDCHRVVGDYVSLIRQQTYFTRQYGEVGNYGLIPEVSILDFTKISFEEVLRRDAGRHPSLGYDVLEDYRLALEKEGSTFTITELLQENFGPCISVMTISSEPLLKAVAA